MTQLKIRLEKVSHPLTLKTTEIKSSHHAGPKVTSTWDSIFIHINIVVQHEDFEDLISYHCEPS